MKVIDRRRVAGLTLIEIMVAIVIVAIAVIGAMGYRYYSALDARKADVRMTATRVGLMLLEGWVGARGYADYDPVAEITGIGSDVVISGSGSGPATPGGFTALGSYHIEANNSDYYATLSYKEAGDELKLRLLNAEVAWKHRYMTGPVSGSDPSARMTTYVRFLGDPNSE